MSQEVAEDPEKKTPGKPDADMVDEEPRKKDDLPYAEDEASANAQIDTGVNKYVQKRKVIQASDSEGQDEEEEEEAPPPKEKVTRQINLETENHFKCEIKDVHQFKVCLESVKFPKSSSHKNQFNDVILQAHHSGIVLKSASNSGVIMTRCMIREEFFESRTYKIDIKNEKDKAKMTEDRDAGKLGEPLVEFCLPISELKSIVDGLSDELDSAILINYPTADNMLQVEIPEETRGGAEKMMATTVVHLDTFEAMHTLNAEISLQNSGNICQIFGKVAHFKKALKEFNFLPDSPSTLIELKFQTSYPQLQLIYGSEKFNRYHVVKFNANIDDLVYKKVQDASAFYSIESLRLAFSRITSDSLLCIVSLQEEGYLSVKHMHRDRVLLIESIILAQEKEQEDI